MTELSSEHKQSWWRAVGTTTLSVLRWSPNLSPETYRLVKRSAIMAFAIDVGLLIAVHYGWLDSQWNTIRQWEDAGAMALMLLGMTQAIERRRRRKDFAPPHA